MVLQSAKVVILFFRSKCSFEEFRLRYKREAQVDVSRAARRHKEKLKKLAARRKWYARTHPRKYKGKKRGRKRRRLNEQFRLQVLENGDTVVELLTRCKHALTQTNDKGRRISRPE